MQRTQRSSRGRHHFIIYPESAHERFWAIVLVPVIILACVFLITQIAPQIAPPSGAPVPFSLVALGAFYTLGRLAIAYAFAVVVAVPLAILVTHSATFEKLLLPVFDVMQSVPILALFPIVILLFIRFRALDGAAIFILFLTMVWSIVFSLVGGIKIIPQDVISAARVFGVHGWGYVRQIVLPAIVPQLVTGSMLAVAQGWNIVIVAEVLHTYIPGGGVSDDLFGVGSILVYASANAQTGVFLEAVLVMVVIIAFVNFFVWQKLLHFAQRFRFD